MPEKQNKKILYLIDKLNPGGSERQLILLADGLSREHFTPVIGVLENTEFNKSLDIQTPIVLFSADGLPFIKSIIRCWKLYRYLKKEKFDILQLYFPTATVLGTIAALVLRNRPYIVGTRRNLYHWVDQQKFAFQLYKYFTRWSDHILANSYRVIEASKKLENIPAAKISVIDNGVEVEKYQRVSAITAQNDIGLAGNHPIIGMVGNWRPVKGASIFLKACAEVFKEYDTARFVLAGYGSQKEELINMAKKLGISKCTKFIEGRTDVYAIIPAFDIAVQPSLSESFSNVLVEYMISGKSIVATKVGDAERIITHEQEGLIVEPGNADALSKGILRLLGNREKAREMALAAKAKAEKNWSIEANITEHQKFYESIGA